MRPLPTNARLSAGVEFNAGPTTVTDGTLVITILHPVTQGVSYVDYFRLVPEGGGEARVIEAEALTPKPVPMSVIVPEPPSDQALRQSIEAIHRVLWDRFIDPQTHLLYTEIPAGGISAENPASVEDSSLCGGMYLDAMLLRHACTGLPEDARKARLLFHGLLDNATIAGEPGYIVRGFQPDRKTLRRDPSVDQYTGLLFGLWRYYRSSLAAPEDREAIRRVLHNVLTRLKGYGWTIREPDGTLTRFGHLDAFVPTRAERLLSFLLMGHDVTGDARWLDEYEVLVPSRLQHCVGFPETTSSWVAIQSQLSFRALLDLDPDWSRREDYRRGMAECARFAWAQVPEGVTALPPGLGGDHWTASARFCCPTTAPWLPRPHSASPLSRPSTTTPSAWTHARLHPSSGTTGWR